MLGKLNDLLKRLTPKYDDDAVDRLNYIWTNFILIAFALTIAAKQYVGEPLQCWVPAQFAGGWEKYVENYCFVENTYWVPMTTSHLPDGQDERSRLEFSYYQWVPFVLALQALMFYFPRFIWSIFSGKSGISVTAIISSVLSTQKKGDRRVLKKIDEQNAAEENVANFIQETMHFKADRRQARQATGMRLPRNQYRWNGIYVTFVYLLCKAMYIFNVLLQLVILNSFLGPQYTFWGFEVLRDILQGREWETSGHFPRVTFCDFKVRRLGNTHNWTVQCVLMINMFNEKIYLFLWWWFLVVALTTISNFIYWIFVTFVPNQSIQFIRRYLDYKETVEKKPYTYTETDLKNFVNDSLRKDGITILRLLSDNAGDVVAAAVVIKLWKIYMNKGSIDNSPTSDNDPDDDGADSKFEHPPPPSMLNDAQMGYHEDMADYHEAAPLVDSKASKL